MSPKVTIATIGYEAATVRTFLEALTEHRVQLLVDVRAVASSRRPGFAKIRAGRESAWRGYRVPAPAGAGNARARSCGGTGRPARGDAADLSRAPGIRGGPGRPRGARRYRALRPACVPPLPRGGADALPPKPGRRGTSGAGTGSSPAPVAGRAELGSISRHAPRPMSWRSLVMQIHRLRAPRLAAAGLLCLTLACSSKPPSPDQPPAAFDTSPRRHRCGPSARWAGMEPGGASAMPPRRQARAADPPPFSSTSRTGARRGSPAAIATAHRSPSRAIVSPFGPAMSTKMACEDGDELERRYLPVLPDVTGYRALGLDPLARRCGSGSLARFRGQ